MKKVLIFTCIGGGGHISASNALEAYLKSNYNVEQLDIFAGPIGHIDPLYWLTFKKYNGEDLYNFFMRHRLFFAINLLFHMGCFFFWINEKRIIKNLIKTIQKHKPDIIVSVIPIINHCCVVAAQACNVPFILSPTDLDVTTFIRRMGTIDNKPFQLVPAFNHPLIEKPIKHEGISSPHITKTGFVLRPSFFQDHDKQDIKAEFGIPTDTPVITLMMGAIGSKTLVQFVKTLAYLERKAHLIICIGKNESLKQTINALSFGPQITYTLVGFTQKVASLLYVTDIFITKSGSVSFCEGLYTNTPMLLDATSTVLSWEKLNHTFLEAIGGGISCKSYKQLSSEISRLLASPHELAIMRKNLERLEKKNGAQEIKELIKQLL